MSKEVEYKVSALFLDGISIGDGRVKDGKEVSPLTTVALKVRRYKTPAGKLFTKPNPIPEAMTTLDLDNLGYSGVRISHLGKDRDYTQGSFCYLKKNPDARIVEIGWFDGNKNLQRSTYDSTKIVLSGIPFKD